MSDFKCCKQVLLSFYVILYSTAIIKAKDEVHQPHLVYSMLLPACSKSDYCILGLCASVPSSTQCCLVSFATVVIARRNIEDREKGATCTWPTKSAPTAASKQNISVLTSFEAAIDGLFCADIFQRIFLNICCLVTVVVETLTETHPINDHVVCEPAVEQDAEVRNYDPNACPQPRGNVLSALLIQVLLICKGRICCHLLSQVHIVQE